MEKVKPSVPIKQRKDWDDLKKQVQILDDAIEKKRIDSGLKLFDFIGRLIHLKSWRPDS